MNSVWLQNRSLQLQEAACSFCVGMGPRAGGLQVRGVVPGAGPQRARESRGRICREERQVQGSSSTPPPSASPFLLLSHHLLWKRAAGNCKTGFQGVGKAFIVLGPLEMGEQCFIHLFRQNKHPAILLKLASFWIDRCHQFVLCHLLNIFNIASVTTQASLPSLSTH